MSVQVNTYVMVGAMLPFDACKDRDEELEPYEDSAFEGIKHHDGLCIVADGMNGKYVAVGRVIAKSDDSQGLDDVTKLPLRPPHDAEELREKIAKLFPGWANDLSVMVFSHYR